MATVDITKLEKEFDIRYRAKYPYQDMCFSNLFRYIDAKKKWMRKKMKAAGLGSQETNNGTH